MRLGGFVKKSEVLKLIAERTKEGKATSFKTLVRELGLSPDAACSHLKRLWRERLIKSTGYPSSHQEAVAIRQSVREVTFRIRRRGVERLSRWEEREIDDGWSP